METLFDWSIDSRNGQVAIVARPAAKTTGLVLVASVGSYCAYRFCAQYMDKSFVWTFLEGSQLDTLNRTDSRLLHPAAEGVFYTHRTGTVDNNAYPLGANKSFNLFNTETTKPIQVDQSTYRLASTRSGSPVRIVCQASESIRKRVRSQKGLEAISSNPKSNVTTRSALKAEQMFSNFDGGSDITSISRIQPVPAYFHSDYVTDVDGDVLVDENNHFDEPTLAFGSRANSSVRVDDLDLSWEEEFSAVCGFNAQNPLFVNSPTPSDISELSAVKNLERMLAQRTSSPTAASLIQRFQNTNDRVDMDSDSASNLLHNVEDLIRSKCSTNMTDLYESVHLGDCSINTFGDSISVISFNSTSSFRTAAQKSKSRGLNDLLKSSPISNTCTSERSSLRRRPPVSSLIANSRCVEKSRTAKEPAANSTLNSDDPISQCKPNMSDSCFSRSSVSSAHLSGYRRLTMFDSAIYTDFQSSEDEQSSVSGQALRKPSNQLSKRSTQENEEDRRSAGIKGRNCLDKINETNSPKRFLYASLTEPSLDLVQTQQLEWFDDAEPGIDDYFDTPV